jgi:hypothetical protein
MAITALILGDGHSGSVAGLTPPSYWPEQLKIQHSLFYGWYLASLERFGPWDMIIGTGDATDGPGKKESISTLIPDTLDQAKAAMEVYQAPGVKGENIFLVRGTPFHSTGTYNYEDPLAEYLGASIADEQLLTIKGLNVHVRHTASRSDTAYGQGTPLFRESIRDLLDPSSAPADLVLRGHIHYYTRVSIGERTAISNPCMQLPGTVFGRKCTSMYYHVGIGKLTVRSKDDWDYRPILLPIASIKKREYKSISIGE